MTYRYLLEIEKLVYSSILSFMGKSIIEHQIELYRECGIDRIIVVTGFASEKICYSGITYYKNEEYADTNMVHSLMAAKEEFNDDIIVSYSDILFEKKMLLTMMNSPVEFGVAVDKDWQAYWKKRYGRVDFDTESLSLDQKNNIIELGLENPGLEDIDARYIGLLRFSKSGLSYIEGILEEAYKKKPDEPWQQSGKPVKKAYMTDLLNAIIESGKTVKAISFERGWIEFDTNEDYENICKWVEDGRIKELITLEQ